MQSYKKSQAQAPSSSGPSTASPGVDATDQGLDSGSPDTIFRSALSMGNAAASGMMPGAAGQGSALSSPSDAAEVEASSVARSVASGDSSAALDVSSSASSGMIHREEAEQAPGPQEGEAPAENVYTVVAGDTLWGIATRMLGGGRRWREIYALNREVIGGNPNLILPGQQLRIPAQPVPPDTTAPPVAEELPAGDGAATPPAEGGEQEETPAEGSAIIVGESGATEYGFTNRFTPDLVALLQNQPNASLDDILGTIGDDEYQVNYTSDPTFPQPELHPTLASYGEKTDENSSGNKSAVLIANENYTGAALAGVTAQASGLESQLTARGYTSSGVVTDQNAGGMSSTYSGAVSAAEEGDELVAYFIGHGSPDGLIGIDYPGVPNDVFSNAQVASVLSTATNKGAHIRFLIDACHAGSAVQTVRQERMNELAGRTDDPMQQFMLGVADTATNFRQKLIDHVNARHNALSTIQSAINDHNAAPPSGSITGAISHAATGVALQAAFAATEQAYDQKIERTWAEALPFFVLASVALNVTTGSDLNVPLSVSDHSRLGDQIDFLDDFINACIAPVDAAQREPASDAADL